MQNKKSIIIGVASGIGVFVLLVVLVSFASANNLKGDFVGRMVGIFSREEISKVKEQVKEKGKGYNQDKIMDLGQQKEGAEATSVNEIRINIIPESGNYSSAQNIYVQARFFSGGVPLPYSVPVQLYYDNLDDDIEGLSPYLRPIAVKENRSGTNQDIHLNRIHVVGYYDGAFGLGEASYYIEDSVAPEFEKAVYKEGGLYIKFKEVMDIQAISTDELIEAFEFKNGTTIQPNTYAPWGESYKDEIMVPIENSQGVDSLTYRGKDLIKDASGNPLKVGSIIEVTTE